MAPDSVSPEFTAAYIPEGAARPLDAGVAGWIGPYKLLHKLGEGGMGEVWLAEQREPVERRVALKLIRPGKSSPSAVARFEAERQALALMDHPNIAKVLDAGTTDAGRPYFVMELVKGIALNEYCDQEHLGTRERLELFVPVCQAVQHAHQKGILHRDLKSSNVLVCLYDGTPVPKVIDFGLAKALNQRLTDDTVFTQVGQIVGTIEYMAPEQADPNNMDVDTRADVYSLGVILYELLTGSKPFPSDELRSANFAQLMRILHEVDPPRPSTRLSLSGELIEIAARRKVEPARLKKQIHGELDWIVMKCLEKDRVRRYETVNGLAMDVKRFLANEPVSAGPPSAVYRVKKFMRRHWATVTAAGVVLLVLTIGAIGTTIGLVEARRQKAAAEEALGREAQQRMRADEASARASQYAAAEGSLIDQFLVKLGDDRLAQVPGLEPARLQMMEVAIQRYRDLLLRQPDDDALHADAAQAFRRTANLYRMTGRMDKARAAYGEALAKAREVIRRQPTSVAGRRRLGETLCDLGTLIERTEGPRAAEPIYREALETGRQLRAEASEDPDVLTFAARSETDLSSILHERGQDEEALALARSAARTFSNLADRPKAGMVQRLLAAFAWNTVAQAARECRHDDEAAAAVAEALRRADDSLLVNPGDPNLRYTRAWARLEAGRAAGASKPEAALDDAVAALEELVKDFGRTTNFSRKLAEALTARSRARLLAGRPEDAGKDARRAIDTLEKLERLPGMSDNLDAPFAVALTLAAKAATLQGQNTAAKPLYESARRRLGSAMGLNPESRLLQANARELNELARQIGPTK
jgi:serine/threonine protein kinase/tetratricopeptide (TPR) repeat protein